MSIPRHYTPVVWGAVGGIAPHVVRLASILINSGPQQQLTEIVYPAYCVGLLLIAAIGGAVVACFREPNSRKAFFLGISAPALITIATTVQQAKETRRNYMPPASVSFIPFVSSAYADDAVEPVALSTIPGRVIEVFTVGQSETFSVVFRDQNGNVVQEVFLPQEGFSQVVVPPSAEMVCFKKADTFSKSFGLPSKTGGMMAYEVSVSGKRIYNFSTAFGQAPQVTYSFKVHPESIQKAAPGREGWCYAGSFKDGSWQGKFFSMQDSIVPSVGAKLTVIYPVNLRTNPTTQSKAVGQLRLNQNVTVTDVSTADRINYWLKARVDN